MIPVLDLVLVVIILLAFLLVGVYFRIKQKDDSVDYFLAGRSMSALPAALSISVSFISSVSLTLHIGEISRFGSPFYLLAISGLVAGPIIVYLILPDFYDSPYLSIYQFLEDRYSRPVRLINSLIFIFAGVINCATVGYTAAISAETLGGIPFWASVLAIGLLSTIYSTLGGIKAVIWTDVGQAIFMILFFFLILFKALFSFDSIGEAWQLMVAGQRTHLNFLEGPTYRYSFQNVIIFYIIWELFVLSMSQPGVQRWKSVSTLRAAKWTVILSLALFGLFSMLVYITGMAIYAYYARCNVANEPILPEKLSLHFVSKELSSFPGVIGLCLAGILSSALSTISSYINSFAAVTLEDFIKIKYRTLTPSRELLLGKILTAAFGVLATGLIFVTAQSPSAFVIHMTAYSFSVAPPLGTFLLGIWTKRANFVGVSLGFAVSVTLVVWLSIGSYLMGSTHVGLPEDNPLCEGTNASLLVNRSTSVLPTLLQDNVKTSGVLDALYSISFHWYAAIGLATSVVLGYAFSLCFDVISKKGRRGNEE